MIDFQYLDKSKLSEYRQYYDADAIGCEANFVTAWLWSREYNIKAAIVDDTLIKVYLRDDGGVWGYCMPQGKNVREAVELIFQDAKERGQRACFGYLSQKERDMLESICPGRFAFERSDTTQDYIYRSADLANLAGKKYHAKRNHISRFFRTYEDAFVRDITPENKGDALKVAQRWCEENAIRHIDHTEYGIIAEALDNLEGFGMRGIVLYAGGQAVAMALGSEISPQCFDINFEKALTAYEGSYAVINNEFAGRLQNYRYINREEDLGLEGLRKSKLSYHPAILYDRYDGVPKW